MPPRLRSPGGIFSKDNLLKHIYNMKASTLCLGILAVAGFLYLSCKDFEAELESAEIERQLLREAERVRVADSLGLAGRDWLDFVNMED